MECQFISELLAERKDDENTQHHSPQHIESSVYADFLQQSLEQGNVLHADPNNRNMLNLPWITML